MGGILKGVQLSAAGTAPDRPNRRILFAGGATDIISTGHSFNAIEGDAISDGIDGRASQVKHDQGEPPIHRKRRIYEKQAHAGDSDASGDDERKAAPTNKPEEGTKNLSAIQWINRQHIENKQA
jgi:hypothetical protein